MWLDAPNRRRLHLSACAALSLVQTIVAHTDCLEGIAALLDEGADGIRAPRVRVQYAVHPGRKHVAYLPGVRQHLVLRLGIGRQCGDDGRRPVSAARRTGGGEASHEPAEPYGVERVMLELDHHDVGPGAGHVLPVLVRQFPGAGRVQRLPLFQQFDCAIDPRHGPPHTSYSKALAAGRARREVSRLSASREHPARSRCS